MSTPAAKRRRLGNASETLHKPFKSPFRSAQTPSNQAHPAPHTPHTPSQHKLPPSATKELITLRADIQTLTQAHRLATSSTDTDLEVLRAKWQAASRAAAEEIFAGTRDRVNRMGGVRGWREREREQREFMKVWDREELAASGGQGGDEGDEGLSALEEAEGAAERERVSEKSEDDESFTMDMMLKTLNIDIDLIGYDNEAQRWVD